MKLNRIRVETNGSADVMRWRVFLGDQDISDMVNSITITGSVNDSVARVHLVLVAVVEFPHEIQAVLTAEVVEPE